MMNIPFQKWMIHKADRYVRDIDRITRDGEVTNETGEYKKVKEGIPCLIVPLSTRQDYVFKSSEGQIEKDMYLMYLSYDEEIEEGDYIKFGENYFFVVMVERNIPRNHHKEVFLKLSGNEEIGVQDVEVLS